MTYTIGIVTHPIRLDMAKALAEQVGAQLVMSDDLSWGERWCHTEALRHLARTSADRIVLLEDDALPIDDFKASLERALDDTYPAIVSLYLGQGNWAGVPRSRADTITNLVTTADRDNAHWIDTNALYHAVGVAIPTEWALDLIANLDVSTQPTDRAITAWARDHDHPIRYTWPSLVDHADGPPIVKHPTPRSSSRVAWRTGTWPTP